MYKLNNVYVKKIFFKNLITVQNIIIFVKFDVLSITFSKQNYSYDHPGFKIKPFFVQSGSYN